MTEDEKITVWVTKYVMTKGVLKMEVERTHSERMVGYKDGGHFPTYFHKPYWHETEEEAVAHAKKMRKKKIGSLKRQLDKVKKLNFTVVDKVVGSASKSR